VSAIRVIDLGGRGWLRTLVGQGLFRESQFTPRCVGAKLAMTRVDTTRDTPYDFSESSSVVLRPVAVREWDERTIRFSLGLLP
jgi:hypothetical protein